MAETGSVTRESARAIAEHTGQELVPAPMKAVSRATDGTSVLLSVELNGVSHETGVLRNCDARSFDRWCRATWAELVQQMRSERPRG